MPLYVADYHKDTRRLSTLQHGAYLLLIMDYWANGSLPDDDALLAQIAGLSAKEWKASRPVLASLFMDGWKHKRVEAELAKAAEISDKRKANAGKRWSKRDANAQANADANDLHHGRVSQPQPPSPKEPAAAGSLAAAPEIDVDEVERCCRQASGGWDLRRADVILDLVKAGHDLDDRVLPLIREEAARRRKKSQPPPDTWAYFKPMIEDAARKPLPAAKEVAAVFVPLGSPAWQELAKVKRESLLFSMLKSHEGV
jgi:uncharacterized protein YdaU (DUF1376 family)